jgi:hypothetical protein
MGFYGVGSISIWVYINSESHGYFSILFLKGQGLEGMNINITANLV